MENGMLKLDDGQLDAINGGAWGKDTLTGDE